MKKRLNRRPTRRTEDLGKELHALRRRKGITGVNLAERLGISQATISRIENGSINVSADYLAQFTSALGLTQREAKRLFGLLKAAKSESGQRTVIPFSIFETMKVEDSANRQRRAEELENAALQIRLFQPTLVPGILQTDDYTRSVLARGGVIDNVAIDNALAARSKRRRFLESGKRLTFVIAEAALRNRVAATSVMIEQLEKLDSKGYGKDVAIGILPMASLSSNLLLTNFTLFDDDQLYVELSHGEIFEDNRAVLDYYAGIFADALKVCTRGRETERLLGTIRRWYEQLNAIENGAFT